MKSPLNKFYRFQNNIRAGLFLAAIVEGTAFSAVCLLLFYLIDTNFPLYFSTRIALLSIWIGGLFTILIYQTVRIKARTDSPHLASILEPELEFDSGQLTAVLDFDNQLSAAQSNQDGLFNPNNPFIVSEQLARQAVDSAAQKINSASLFNSVKRLIPLKTTAIELAIILIVFCIFAVIPCNSRQICITRFFNPADVQTYLPAAIPTVQPPKIQNIELRVIPPASTLEGAFTLSDSQPSKAPQNSTIRFFVETDIPLYKAILQIQSDSDTSPENLSLESMSEHLYSISSLLESNLKYRFVLTSAPKAITQTDWHTITVIPDDAPKTKLSACLLPNMEVVKNALIPLEIHAYDDYGLLTTSLRWRILKESEIQSGSVAGKIVYQRQPVWNAFDDESIKRPPKQKTDSTVFNLNSMEILPGAQIDVFAQSTDTRSEEGDSQILRLNIVTPDQLNTLLIAARLRLKNELIRAIDTLNKAQKESDPNSIDGLYKQFTRQIWGDSSAVKPQLYALIERVKMNHLQWGRTLVELENVYRKLNQTQKNQAPQIERLIAILKIDSNDNPSRQSLAQQLESLNSQLNSLLNAFGQWTQYRELTESFRQIQSTVENLEKKARTGFSDDTISEIRRHFPAIALKTKQWKANAEITLAVYNQADNREFPQAKKWASAISQVNSDLNWTYVQPLFSQVLNNADSNTTIAYSAIIKLRETYDQSLAILNASGDTEAQKRLLLKADIQQVLEIQQNIILETTNHFKQNITNNRDVQIKQANLAVSQKELALRVESIQASHMTVVSDALFQTKTLMFQAAQFIEQKKPIEVITLCQKTAVEHLEQIIDTLNSAEQLAILALNQAKESDEADSDQDKQPETPDKPQSKVAIEDLKLLELSQQQLLDQTRLAFSEAIEAGSMKVSPETAAILADKQQRLASLTWFLTTASMPPELLRGERPKDSTPDNNTDNSDQSSSLDDNLLGDLSLIPESKSPALTDEQIQQQEKIKQEKEFIDTLWNQLGTAAVSEEDAPLLEIVRYMRQTFELFKLRDCGEINQGLQQQICEHLDKFINQISFNREKTKDKSNQDPAEQENKPENKPENSQDNQPTVDTSAPESGEKTADGNNDSLTPEQYRGLLRKIWGELPPSIQKFIAPDSNQQIFPEYQKQIQQYWNSLQDKQ